MTMTQDVEPQAVPVRRPHLTDRETQVLRLIAEGYTISEIQPMLTQPVQRGSHKGRPPGRNAAQGAAEQLRIKFGARTLSQVVHNAHRLGFLGDEDEVTLP